MTHGDTPCYKPDVDTPITITAENPNGGVRVQVQIKILKKGALDASEARWLKLGIADAVMQALALARYLTAPMATQKVKGG